jgi:Pyridoxamine 5'-phosphate oxidase
VTGSVRLTSAEAWEVVVAGQTAVLTTLRSDGWPISVPVWFVTAGDRIYVRTFGAKVGRLAHDSRASFLVETGTRWSEFVAAYLSAQATVQAMTPELDGWFQAEMAAKYGDRFTRWEQMPAASQAYYARTPRSLVTLTPVGPIRGWDNRRAAGRRPAAGERSA